jgi:uncharacterized protein YjaG (DUF416 family)
MAAKATTEGTNMKDRNPETNTLTSEEWDSLWEVIATVRDGYERTANDADTGDIVDAVEGWLSNNGFA